jgi:hypothetical protein
MASNTQQSGIPYPELSDEPNIEQAVKPAVEHLDSRIVPRYSSTTERDGAIVDPVGGQLCYVTTDGLMVRLTSPEAWVPLNLPDAKSHTYTIPPQTITSTSMAALPDSSVAVSLTLPAPCYCDLYLSGWAAVTGAVLRVGMLVSGATTVQVEGGQNDSDGTSNTWGTVARVTANGQFTAHKYLKLNAGTNTIAVRANRESTSTAPTLSYLTLTAIPRRWAAV